MVKPEMNDVYRAVDLKALKCLWTVAQRGGLTRAGIELGISQSAVSQRLKSLEDYLGVKLYEVGGGRVRLTQAGQRTMDLAASLLEQLEDFERELAGSPPGGAVVLAAEDDIQLYLLPDVLQRFKGIYPGVRLQSITRSRREILELVRTNEADVGLVAEALLPEGLVFHAWQSFPAYVVMQRGHPLVRRGSPPFQALLTPDISLRYPLILAADELGRVSRVEEGLQRLGLPFNVAFEVGSMQAVKHYAARGLGLGVVSGICLTQEDKATLEALEIPAEFRGETMYGVALRRNKRITEPLRDLLNLLGAGASQIHGPGWFASEVGRPATSAARRRI